MSRLSAVSTVDIALVPDGWRPLRLLAHPREVIRHFTPNWFAVTMGTGIVSLILPQIPLAGPALRPLGGLLWVINIIMFSSFLILYGACWLLFSSQARHVFRHNTASMFLGTIPMGLATIINGFVVFGPGLIGAAAISVAHGLWWADVALSVASGAAIPYFMFTRQEHRLDQMTGVWLLPVVAAEVAAASGGLIAPHLAGGDSQITVLMTSYVLWAYSVPVAFSILGILILRMALYKLPSESMAASSWLALGPIGTGALGMLLLGWDAPPILARAGLAGVGEVAQGLGLIAGLTLWGFGAWWLLQAAMITARYFRGEVPFNLGWWGYTFPIGVYTAATLKLGTLLSSPVFMGVGAVLAAVLVSAWVIVAARTAKGAWEGHLFASPFAGPAPVLYAANSAAQ